MRLRDTPLLTSERIRRRVSELGCQISADFAGHDLTMLVVLKGGIVFASDLMRDLAVPLEVEFIRARSYAGTQSNGGVEITVWPETPVTGKHVLLVEDILDTGRTSTAMLERLRAEHPARLELCVLLDKPSRRIEPIQATYVGFTIDDVFVVGYGLDYEQRGRALPDIRVLEMG